MILRFGRYSIVSLIFLIYLSKAKFFVGIQYVHLLEENGHGARVTCDTLGYYSILTENECIEAAQQIKLTQSYLWDGVLDCSDRNPNNCFIETEYKRIYFTPANCPVHQLNLRPTNGLICKKWGRLYAN